MDRLTTFVSFKHPFSKKKIFYLYLFSFGLVYLIECIMSYYFPVAIEKQFGSNISAGLIIGLTNVTALIVDMLIPQLFKNKGWKFLLLAGVLLQVGFPSFTFLGIFLSSGILFITAAIFWNIYYEFLSFSRHSFIAANEQQQDYARDWGALSVVMSIGSIMGPIIGSAFLKDTLVSSAITIGVIHLVIIVMVVILIVISPNHPEVDKIAKTREHPLVRVNIFREISFWRILEPEMFPIMFLGFLVTIINAAVWTMGGILGEQILGKFNLDWLIIFMFNLPVIFTSLFMTRLKIQSHKKRLSQVTFILSLIPLLSLTIIKDDPILVVLVFFITSLFISVSWIFNETVYSDLSKRAKHDRLHISGMERIDDSLGYLVGPILIGFLADKTDFFTGFTIIAAVSLLCGIFLIIKTPRKLKLPEEKLHELDARIQA